MYNLDLLKMRHHFRNPGPERPEDEIREDIRNISFSINLFVDFSTTFPFLFHTHASFGFTGIVDETKRRPARTPNLGQPYLR